MKKFLPHFRQFVKFCIVGVTSTITDVGIYTLLTRTTLFFSRHYLLANAISFIIALINSYTLNRRFTFRDNHKEVAVQFTKYAGVYIIGLGLSEAILYILVDHFGVYDLMAKGVAIAIVLFWNFIGSKFFIFKSNVHREIQQS
jgi:putative flippase GtrA